MYNIYTLTLYIHTRVHYIHIYTGILYTCIVCRPNTCPTAAVSSTLARPPPTAPETENTFSPKFSPQSAPAIFYIIICCLLIKTLKRRQNNHSPHDDVTSRYRWVYNIYVFSPRGNE